VGTTIGLHTDPVLTGLWRAKMTDGDSGERDAYFHFLPKLDGSITVVLVEGGDKPDRDWMVASVTSATIGPYHFLNAKLTNTEKEPDGENPTPNSFPMLYRFEGPRRITLFFMNEDATKAAIKAGLIQGTVEDSTMGDATITADPKTLDSFVSSKKGVALFSQPYATLTKME
jgi:hypothetical protein